MDTVRIGICRAILSTTHWVQDIVNSKTIRKSHDDDIYMTSINKTYEHVKELLDYMNIDYPADNFEAFFSVTCWR
jgi:hypothetical protein